MRPRQAPATPGSRAARARTARAGLAGLGVVLTALLGLTGCDYDTTVEDAGGAAGATTQPTVKPTPEARDAGHKPRPHDQHSDGPSDTHRDPARFAAAALAQLPVKGRAPMTGYDREEFGPAWLDADRNGCDTRNDILGRDLAGKKFDPATHGCVVLSGILADHYTGTRIRFVRGDGTLVDIDHVVALGNAWATGANRWPIKKAAAFANDPTNLLPVDASANRQKGDGDAATWLPANKSYRCAYVARQVAVKAKYRLWVTPPEKAAIGRVLVGCPRRKLPADSGVAIKAPVNVPHPEESHGDAGGGGDSSGSVYFENCDAARAAGAAPVHRGDPGYGSHLDRDGDGVGCE